jgi:hypothetical protein
MMDDQPIQPAALPTEVLKNRRAINLYFIAVGALAIVVVVIPLVSVWGNTVPAELWTGWNVCIGGLIALIGAQGQGGSNG